MKRGIRKNVAKSRRSLAEAIELETSGSVETYPYCKLPPHYFDRMLELASHRRNNGIHLSILKWGEDGRRLPAE